MNRTWLAPSRAAVSLVGTGTGTGTDTGTGPRRLTRRRALVALTAPLVAALAACGGTSSPAAPATSVAQPASTASYPVTIEAANGSVTLKSQPKRIVSLTPSGTEMLYAIGAGPQIIAVDSLSDFPAQAPKTQLSGFKPNVEAVAGYNPDLVVAANDVNGLVAGLGKLGVPVLLLPAPSSLEVSYAQEVQLGQATGHVDAARTVVRQTKDRIAAAVASVPKPATSLKIYHELDPTYYTVTSSTFIGSVYRLVGLNNIADGAKGAAASGGFPQLSAEYVVSQAPDLIVLADGKCCQQTAATVAARPAFATVPAVKNGRVIVIDDSIASRWGPRTADFVEAVAKALGGA